MRKLIVFILITLLPVAGWSFSLSCEGYGRFQEWNALLGDVFFKFDENTDIYTIEGLAAEEGHVMKWFVVAKKVNEDGEIIVVHSNLKLSNKKGIFTLENEKWRLKFSESSDDQKYTWEYFINLKCDQNI